MSNPDQIRADIERTRGNLSADVNALGNSVSPGNVARRQVDKARGAGVAVKDRVMGATSSAGSSVNLAASSASDAVTGAPAKASSQTRGNPLAAGLFALSAGWLLGSILPASSKEVEVAATVKDNAGALAAPVKEAAKDAAQEL